MSPSSPRWPDGRAILYVAAICLAVLGLEFWREWTAREAAFEASGREAQNLAFSLRQQADDTFELARSTVSSIVGQIEAAGGSAAEMAGLQVVMDRRLGTDSPLQGLYVIDGNGRWVKTTAQNLPPGGFAELPEVFAAHARSDSKTLQFGAPVGIWSTDRLVITVSQRFNDDDGNFGGVVLATITADHFSRFYSGFDVGDHGAILLATTDGLVLSRAPYHADMIGRRISAGALSERLHSGTSGISHYISPLDGVPRIGGVHVSARFPVATVVALSEDEAVAGWAQAAVQRLPVLLILLFGIALLGVRLVDQVGRRLHSERNLRRRDAEFRLLAESASDLVELYGPTGRIYSSPALARITGYTSEELAGRSPESFIEKPDREAVLEAGRRLMSGQSEQETVAFRIRHKRGHQLWLESSLRVTPADDSGACGVVAVTRDVTERKQLEIRLSSMASADGLTGIANRRALDAALAREVAAASRDGTPISVLMVDADRFKRFNDDYGHLEGDSCLKAIAGIVAAAARRPRDLAARFGGEEMVLVLPGTTADDARALGVAICQDVQALDIPHARNQPWNTVTVSIGVGTLGAADAAEAFVPATLLQRADRCLYDAKAQGRNQCVAPPPVEAARLVS